MSVRGKYEQLKDIIQELEMDIDKFTLRGNKSAGIRIRRCMLEIKELATDIRKDILDSKKI